MCCALNSLDAMKNTTFGKLVEELQNDEQQKNPEKKVSALVGKREGVSLVVDLHSNHASFGTVTDSYRAFNMFIGGPTEFPVLRERGIQLEPGKEHSLQFSGNINYHCLVVIHITRSFPHRTFKASSLLVESVSSETRGTSSTTPTIHSPIAGALPLEVDRA